MSLQLPPIPTKPIRFGNARRKSRRPMVHLFSRVFGKVIALYPPKMDQLLSVLGPRLGLSPELLPILADWDEDDWDPDDQDKEDKDNLIDGVQHINVMGTLVHRSSGLDAPSGLVSYQTLTRQVQNAASNPAVRGILFNFESGGGETDGLFELADLIYGIDKPKVALVDACACSAAFGLASQCDRVLVTRTAMCGSVGCFMLHVDESGADAMQGKRYEYVFAGSRKVDANEHSALSPAARTEMQMEVNRVRGMLAGIVARGRGVSVASILATEAGVSYGPAACPLFADDLGTLDEAHAYLCAGSVDLIEGGNQPGDRLGPFARLPQAPMRLLSAPAGGHSAVLSAEVRRLRSAGRMYASALPVHHTPTTDVPWSASENEARLKDGQPASYYRGEYAYQKESTEGTHRSDYSLPHHMVSASGDIGAANVRACQSAIGSLNGAHGNPPDMPDSDRRATYAHLAAHLRDAGLEPPELQDTASLSSLLQLEDAWGGLSTFTQLDLSRMITRERGGALTQVAERKLSMLTRLQALRQSYPKAVACQRTAKRAATAAGRTICMLPCPYDGFASLGNVIERYRPGCFKGGLGEDVICWFANHSDNTKANLLGRVSAGNLSVFEAADGVHATCTAPNTSVGDDCLELLRAKILSGCSAGFWLIQESREQRPDGSTIRWVERAILHDVSLEAEPLYRGATATAAAQAAGLSAAVSAPRTAIENELALIERELQTAPGWKYSELRRRQVELMRKRVS